MFSGRGSRESSLPTAMRRPRARVVPPNRGTRLWFSNPRFPRMWKSRLRFQNAALCQSVRHREDQNAIVSLIGKHSQIRELVYGNAELRRTAEPERAAGLKRIGKRVNDGNG